MYKKVSAVSYAAHGFVDKIDRHFKECIKDFMEEFEYSLLNSLTSSKTTYTFEEFTYLRKVVKATNTFPLNFNNQTKIEILESIIKES